jgi:hypothetical protein
MSLICLGIQRLEYGERPVIPICGTQSVSICTFVPVKQVKCVPARRDKATHKVSVSLTKLAACSRTSLWS